MKPSGLLPDESWKRIPVIFFYIIIIILALWLFCRYLLGILLPFFAAWLISCLLQPALSFSLKYLKFPKRPFCLVFLLIIMTGAGSLLFLIGERLAEEIKSLFLYLSENSDAIISGATELAEAAAERFPLSDRISTEYILSIAGDMLRSTIASLTAQAPALIYRFVEKIPDFVFCVFIILFATYYFSADFDKINRFFGSLLPPRAKKVMGELRSNIFTSLFKYLRAYLLIMFVTFAELLVGFLVLKVEYAFTLALVIAFVDIFPVLGVGTVLLPWAAFRFLCGDYYLGFGLLIVYAIVLLVRQLAEPKIVGITLGLYPLVTVFAIYAGYKLLGVFGMLVSPIAAMLLQSVLSGSKGSKAADTNKSKQPPKPENQA